MSVQPTSLDAYNDTAEYRLGAKERIWEFMITSGGAWCIRSIGKALDIERNIVSPRMGELRDSGWLVEVGLQEDDQGRMVRHYRAVVPDGQECE